MKHTSSSWLRNLIIVGREGEEDDPYERDAQGQILEEDGEKVLKDGWELDEENNPVKIDDEEEEDEGEDENDPVKLKEKLDAKEKALRAERKKRREAEREARRAKKAEPGEKNKEENTQELEAERIKNSKLADRLRQKEIDDAIRQAATKLNFIDPSDALIDEVRREIDVEQDEDDPTDIDIDFDSVSDAVKDLADRKKHLLRKPGEGEPSGTRFSSRNRRGNQDSNTEDKVLQGRYPSLQ